MNERKVAVMPFDAAILTIADRADLSEDALKTSVEAYNLIRERNPAAEVHLLLYGWDDDPEELWEIPESAEAVRRWANLANLTTLEACVGGQLHNWSIGLLAKCGALADVSPGEVRVTGK